MKVFAGQSPGGGVLCRTASVRHRTASHRTGGRGSFFKNGDPVTDAPLGGW